ncbi:protein GVQW3-like [Diabrotica undecimpunctata]|uniref:protein GVQW3-like n=1 Tax=Diabrotica undecimpunctata TaxID=50387 RepID=UPI003B63BE7C
MCDEKHEHRINVKFLVKFKKTPTECYNLLKEAYGENSLCRARVFEWYKRFSEGAEDDQRPGPPVSVSTPQTVTKINEIVRGDHSMSIRMIAETVNANKETVRKILHDELNMKKVCEKLVPKKLTPDKKLVRQQIRSDFLERLHEEPQLIENIINCDETWIFKYDVETKRQSMYWKTPASPRMKKARMSKSKIKAMLIVFFDINIVMTEWVPEGQTVNQTYYLKVLATLREQLPITRCL